MTALHRRIAHELASVPPEPTAWGWYSAVAAAVGCSSQSVYLYCRRYGVAARARLPDRCRECDRPLVGGTYGFCRDCCVAWGRAWMGGCDGCAG